MKSLKFIRNLCVAATLVSSFAFAQRVINVSVSSNAITGTGTAAIVLVSQGNENAVGFSVTFDPAVLRFDSFAAGTDLGGGQPVSNVTQATSGRLGFIAGLAPGASFTAGNRTLVTITFTVLTSSSSASIAFGNTPTFREVSDPAAQELSAVFNALTIAANLAPTAPSLTTQPTALVITSGQNASFTAAASGNPAPTFKWQKDAVDISNSVRVSGATTSTLTITGALSTDAGSYRAVATNATGAVTSTAATLTVNKAAQDIGFSPLTNKTFGDSTFTLAATASSGLALSYSSATPTVATVAGNVVTIVGAGSSVITASQAGNSEYAAATNATQTLTVNKAAATVTLAGLTATYNNSPKAVTATTSPASLPVTITYDGNATAPTAAGSYAVVATITSANHAGSANGTLVIGKADQTISFGTLSQKLFSDAAFNLSATASSSLPVSYASSSAAVATVSGNTVTIVGVGSTTITASQSGNTNFNAATAVTQVQVVANALQ
ncbi:MAG: MBG domain-containing protein, partial [Verrucomicrobia bacterium]|nr:MBG domain-containing protein [Verrucomicrobiota bacterium]